LVNLWLTGNDQSTYTEIREIVRSAETRHDAAGECSEYVERLCCGDDPESGLAMDLLRGALNLVDWYRIAESLRED
jgi:hypothetical protein